MLRGQVQAVKKVASQHRARQRFAMRFSLPVAGGLIDFAQLAARLQRDQPPEVLGGQRARDASAIASYADFGDIRVAPVVDRRLPAQHRFAPAQLHAERLRKIDIGDDTLMQQQLVTGQLGGFSVGGVAHVVKLARTHRLERGNAADDPRLGPHFVHELEPLGQIRRAQETPDVRQRLRQAAGAGRVQQCLDFDAGLHVLPRDKIEQWSATGQHRTLAGDNPGRLEHRLGSAHRHDARQGPARDREGSLLRARGKDDVARLQHAGLAGNRIANLETAIRILCRHAGDRPDRRPGFVACVGSPERLHQRLAVPVILAQRVAILQGCRRDRAVNLPAGGWLLIKQHRIDAVPGGKGRCRQPRRAPAYHQQIALRDSGHVRTCRAPLWRSMFMPSRTRVMQPCWFGWPSMVTRQS